VWFSLSLQLTFIPFDIRSQLKDKVDNLFLIDNDDEDDNDDDEIDDEI